MALHKCLQQAVKERLLVYNPCDAVTLPSGEKPEVVVFTNDQQRALVQASYRHRYGVFIRLDPVYRAADGGVAGAKVGRH